MKVNISLLAIIVQVVFLTLKLTGAVAWSWWIVFIPMMVLAALWMFILFLIVLTLVLVVKYGDS